MGREEARERLKEYLPEYLRMMGIDIGQNMKKKFTCLNPLHTDTNPSMSYDKKRNIVHCFSCGESYDLYDLIGMNENISDFPKQLARAGELFGISVQGGGKSSRSQKKVAQSKPRNERPEEDRHIHIDTYTYTDTHGAEDNTELYRECNARLSQIDYPAKRGLSEKVTNHFQLGYQPRFKAYSKERNRWEEWEVLIIPVTPTSYVARNLDPNAISEDRFRNVGESQIFNLQALKTAIRPIVITEAEIDTMSIFGIGGESIGLGSTNNVDKLLDILEDEDPPVYPFIIALDNDKAGQTATEKLMAGLKEQGKKAYIVNIYGQHKDANEALLADKEAFVRAIVEAESAVIEREEEIAKAEREEYLQQSTASHIQDFVNGISERANTPAIPTGFSELDKVLDGGLYSGLYFVGAISSLGKTSLCLQIVDQIAQSGKDVLVFSLEMARSELMSKSISRHTLIDVLDNGGNTRDAKTNRGITNGARYKTYSQTEKELIQRAIEAYSQYSHHIFIHEGIGDIGVERVREEVEKHIKVTGNVPVILIDYIQILAQPETKKTLTDKQVVDKNVLELKRMSRDLNTPVIGISSFNRDNYYEPVNLASFKESGAIEYSSDILIGLQYEGMDYKDKETDGERKKRIRKLRKDMERRGREGQEQSIQVKVLKNRNGSRGEVFLDYFPMFNRFREAERTSREERR